jgi:translin
MEEMWHDIMEKIQSEIRETSKYLTAKQKEFDSVTDVSRGIIRDSASAITMLHNNDAKGAAKTIKSAYAGVKKLKKSDTKFEYYSRQAYQEYAEATIFYGIKTKETVPSIKEVGVESEAYLLGLMDVMGELKREILEELRNDNTKKAEFYFSKMRLIYDSTRSLRFAEAILNGFRRKQDVARIQLEGAGSEMLASKSKKG